MVRLLLSSLLAAMFLTASASASDLSPVGEIFRAFGGVVQEMQRAAQQDQQYEYQQQQQQLYQQQQQHRQQAAQPAPAKTIQHSSRPAEPRLSVERKMGIQRALGDSGHYLGAIDGAFGPGTRASIERYQAGIGADATGYLTVDQAMHLSERGRQIAAAEQDATRQATEAAAEAEQRRIADEKERREAARLTAQQRDAIASVEQVARSLAAEAEADARRQSDTARSEAAMTISAVFSRAEEKAFEAATAISEAKRAEAREAALRAASAVANPADQEERLASGSAAFEASHQELRDGVGAAWDQPGEEAWRNSETLWREARLASLEGVKGTWTHAREKSRKEAEWTLTEAQRQALLEATASWKAAHERVWDQIAAAWSQADDQGWADAGENWQGEYEAVWNESPLGWFDEDDAAWQAVDLDWRAADGEVFATLMAVHRAERAALAQALSPRNQSLTTRLKYVVTGENDMPEELLDRAEAGDLEAVVEVGRVYRDGLHDVNADAEKADAWLAIATRHNDPRAEALISAHDSVAKRDQMKADTSTDTTKVDDRLLESGSDRGAKRNDDAAHTGTRVAAVNATDNSSLQSALYGRWSWSETEDCSESFIELQADSMVDRRFNQAMHDNQIDPVHIVTDATYVVRGDAVIIKTTYQTGSEGVLAVRPSGENVIDFLTVNKADGSEYGWQDKTVPPLDTLEIGDVSYSVSRCGPEADAMIAAMSAAKRRSGDLTAKAQQLMETNEYARAAYAVTWASELDAKCEFLPKDMDLGSTRNERLFFLTMGTNNQAKEKLPEDLFIALIGMAQEDAKSDYCGSDYVRNKFDTFWQASYR